MANNKTTYVLEIDAEVSSLKSKLETTKTALDKLGDSSFSIGVGKKITSILMQLEKLQKKASQPIDSKATFSSLEKGFGNIVVDAKNLLSELEKISGMTDREKLSLLPENEAKKLKEALGAVQAYTKAVEKAEKARIRSQERRKGERETTNVQLNTAKETYKNAKLSYTNATAKGTEYGNAKTIVAQAEAAKKAQKEIDQLEKQLKKYQKRLEELNNIENRTEEQEAELQSTRSNVKSVGGKIGARKKVIKNAPDEKTLTAANKIIEDQTPVIEALEQSVTQAEKEVTHLENALTRLDEAIKNNSTEITSSQADYKILYEQAKKLGVSLEGVTEDVNPTNVRILTERMRELVTEGIKPLDTAIDEVTPDIQDLGDIAVQTGEKISGAEEHFSSMVDNQSRIDNLKENIKQFIGWAGASKVLSAAMRNAFEDIKQLDAAMTEIAVVTDFDIGDMWDQMPTYTARANELGLEIAEVYEASALFYQQGLDTNEMIALSNETLKMAKIAGLDAAEATDRMTAALRGFNMELDEASAQKVADVYSELAAITASDVDEISSAMTKTASIASSAGMEFETTAAFLSQIIETTRESAETAGTAMKTVIARFQELKKSPDEIGEVDGEIVDANAIEGALRSVGVSLREAGGQFRELDDVFLELSSKWDGLDKNTQRYIATIAAGSRQQSRFIAMMQDYSRTQELVTAANNSAGASQRQYEKTMESLQTKLKRLENAWTEFSTGLLNSDVVKFAVDFLTSLLNALNRVTQGFEGFTGSLSKIGTLVAIFQTAKTIVSKFFDEIIAKIYTSAVSAGENLAQGTQDGINNRGGVKGTVGRLTGYNQIKSGVSKIKQTKILDVDDTKAVQWKREYNDLLVKKNKLEADGLSATEDYQKALDDIQKKEKNRIYTQKEVNEISKEGFKQIIEGAQATGQAIAMVGVGLGIVGQLFAEAGNEGAAEFFQSIGNIFTFVGSAITGVASMIPVFQTLFGGLVAKMVAGGISVQVAWWWVVLIVAAVTALVARIVRVNKAINDNKIENRMKKAVEATEEAKKAAEEAKKAYDNLLSQNEEYDSLQKTLKELTYGTREWKQALVNANQQVLKLIETYPELSKYVSRGAEGQLILEEEGWDKLLELQLQVVKNNDSLKTIDMLKEKNLEIEAQYGNKIDIAETSIIADSNIRDAEGLIEKLKSSVFSGEELTDAEIKDLVEEHYLTISEDEDSLFHFNYLAEGIKNFVKVLKENEDEIMKISVESENVARANLSMLASDEVQQSKYGDQIIDTFSTAISQMGYSNKIDQAAEEFTHGKSENLKNNNEKFQTLANEYSVQGKMTGNDLSDLQTLYKAMTGKEEIPEEIANDIEGLTKEIAKIDTVNKTLEKMDEYANKLEKLNETDRKNISSIFSQSGMSAEYAQSLYANEAINQEKLLEEAQKFGFDSIEQWAKEIDMTTDDFYNQVQKNANFAIKANNKVYEKLNQRLGEAGVTYEKLGQAAESSAQLQVDLSNQQLDALSDKIITAANFTGVESAKGLIASMNKAMRSLSEEEVDKFVNYLGGMNWQNVADWDRLQEVMKSMGVTWTQEIISFVEEAKKASNAIEIIDFKKMNNDLKSVYNTLLSFKSGKEDRSIEEDTYNKLIQSNKDLAKDFIQMGDQYVYTGTSMDNLVAALEENTIALLGQAQAQLDAKIELGELADGFSTTYGGKTLSIDSNYDKWSETELTAFLEDFQSAAYDKTLKGTNDANALSYLDTKGLGLSFLADFEGYSEDDLKEMVGMIKTNANNLTELKEQSAKNVKDSQILSYTMYNSAGKNAEEAQELRNAGKGEEAENYSMALLAQAAQSGLIAESIMSKYSELLKDGVDESEKKEIESLEAKMVKNLTEIIQNQEAVDAKIELQNRIADAIYTNRQEEINKLSEVNESIQSASGSLISKMQEQIDEDRQARANEEAEKDISNLKSQASYLGMSTSGANNLQLIGLKEQIKSAEKDYQDTLVDQALQKLSDANEKAAEQRERQIQLLQAQLDYEKESGAIMDEAITITNSSLDQVNAGVPFESTEGAKLITTAEKWDGKAPEEYQNDMKALQEAAVKAANASIVTNTHDTALDAEGLKTENNANLEDISGQVETLKADRDARDAAVNTVANLTTGQSGYRNGMAGIKASQEYNNALTDYVKAGGSSADFDQVVKDKIIASGGIKTGSLDYNKEAKKGATIKKKNNLEKVGLNNSIPTTGDMTIELNGQDYKASFRYATSSGSGVQYPDVIENMPHLPSPESGWLTAYNGNIYVYSSSVNKWLPMVSDSDGLKTAYLSSLNQYKTGGLADFTGPAWLDGTPSKPEYILNAAQTERFFSLVDVLEGFDTNKDKKSSGGDNYFDIEINVEKIEDDYDIEQMANKIRNMIYEDATYRNVNTINHIR